MSPDQMAEIFDAGWNAIPSKDTSPANALALALAAMADKAREIAARPAESGQVDRG